MQRLAELRQSKAIRLRHLGSQEGISPCPGQSNGLVKTFAAPGCTVGGAGNRLAGMHDMRDFVGVVNVDRAKDKNPVHTCAPPYFSELFRMINSGSK